MGFFIFMGLYEMFRLVTRGNQRRQNMIILAFCLLLILHNLISGHLKLMFIHFQQPVLDRATYISLACLAVIFPVVLREIRREVLSTPVYMGMLAAGVLFALPGFAVPPAALALLTDWLVGWFIVLTLALQIAVLRSAKKQKGDRLLIIGLVGLLLSLAADLAADLFKPVIMEFLPYGSAFFCIFFIADQFMGMNAWAGEIFGPESGKNGELSGIFTARERDIIALLLQGKSYKEIASALFISERTVNVHVQKIYRKAGVNNKTSLAGKLNSAKRPVSF